MIAWYAVQRYISTLPELSEWTILITMSLFKPLFTFAITFEWDIKLSSFSFQPNVPLKTPICVAGKIWLEIILIGQGQVEQLQALEQDQLMITLTEQG